MDYWMNCMLYDWIMMNNPSFRMLYDWIYKKLMVFRDHNLVIFWLLTHPHMMKPYIFLVQATRSFWNRNITPQFMGIPNPPEKRDPSRLRNRTFKRGLVVLCHNCGVELCVYIYICIVEGSLEVKLPTIWTVEKQRWEESEETRSEERRCRCAKR